MLRMTACLIPSRILDLSIFAVIKQIIATILIQSDFYVFHQLFSYAEVAKPYKIHNCKNQTLC